MAEKLNTMVIKVDLQCRSCYKQIKKLLCKFPEIRDQIYDEKQNTVTITVQPCCTERIQDKLYSKGGKTIKSIEMKSPPKPKEPEKKPKESEKPKEPEKKPKDSEKPKEAEKKPKEPEKKPKDPEKKKEVEKAKEIEKPKSDGKTDKPKETEKLKLNEKANKPSGDQKKPPVMAQKSLEPAYGAPIPMYGYPTFYPSGGPCCGPCCNGYGFGQGPCNQAYEARPVPVYDNYGAYGDYGHFGNRGHYVRPDEYFSEENTSACTIM